MKPRGIDLGDGSLLPPELVGVMVLLDRSGSMETIAAAVEKEFGDFVAQQRAAKPDGMWLTLKQFDSSGPRPLSTLKYETTYDRTPLAQVGGLQLQPRGGTPLCDALYRFVGEAKAIIADPADATERLLLLVVTDGQENASRDHNWAEVKGLLDGLESQDVEIVWLGTGEAVAEAQAQVPSFAQAGSTVSYGADAHGAAYMGGAMKAAALGFRSGVSAKAVTASYLARTADGKAALGDDQISDLVDAMKGKSDRGA